MKLKKILILFFCAIVIENSCYATEEIYNEVSSGFGISSFTEEAKQYTKDNFPDFDLDVFVKDSFTGKSNLGFMKKTIINVFGDEITSRY